MNEQKKEMWFNEVGYVTDYAAEATLYGLHTLDASTLT